jgi:hypothetical protein
MDFLFFLQQAADITFLLIEIIDCFGKTEIKEQRPAYCQK